MCLSGKFVREPVDEVHFGRDRPRRAGGTVAHRVDDVVGRSALVGRLDDVEGALGMGDHAAARVLLTERLDLRHGEARVDRTVPLPENQPRVRDILRLQAAPGLLRIPDDHLVERHAHPVSRVAPQVLIGKHQQSRAALPGPGHDGGGIRRRADDPAVVADEGFDCGRRVDVGDRNHALTPLVQRVRSGCPSRPVRASTSRADRARPCRPWNIPPRGRGGSPSGAAREGCRRSPP